MLVLNPYPQTPFPMVKGCVCFVGSASCRAFGHTRPASVPGLSVGLPPSPCLGLRPKPHFQKLYRFFDRLRHNCLDGHKKSAPSNTHRSGKYSAYRLLAEVFLFNKSYTVVDKHLRCLLNIFDTDNNIRSACNLTHYGVHILNVYSAGIYLAHNVI